LVLKELEVKQSLDNLANNWKIEQSIYDLHLGKRDDVSDSQIVVNGVVFHIPYLAKDETYVLWKCLWPDCHNCCERQGRLPLTKDDISLISNKMGYKSESEFIKKETTISSWDETSTMNNVITTISMISLKRKENETEDQDGKPLSCRFLNECGSCVLHPDKPGVCSLYPFSSWMESNNGKPVVHASYQLTGDCPGFYTEKISQSMMDVLQEYSKRIFEYNMSILRTTREKYGFIDIVQ
jgi:Fe-S-cluster containining protein